MPMCYTHSVLDISKLRLERSSLSEGRLAEMRGCSTFIPGPLHVHHLMPTGRLHHLDPRVRDEVLNQSVREVGMLQGKSKRRSGRSRSDSVGCPRPARLRASPNIEHPSDISARQNRRLEPNVTVSRPKALVLQHGWI